MEVFFYTQFDLIWLKFIIFLPFDSNKPEEVTLCIYFMVI